MDSQSKYIEKKRGLTSTNEHNLAPAIIFGQELENK